MARKLMVAAGTLVASAALVASSSAGPPAVEDSGRFLIVQGSLSPPRPSEPGRPQGVELQFDDFGGNIKTGEPPPPSGGVRVKFFEIRVPRGTVYNDELFPRCRLEALDRQGPSACPRGSRIGQGTLFGDVRPVLPDFVRSSSSLAFNGRDGLGRPALLLWTKVAGLTLTSDVRVLPPRPGFGPTFYVGGGVGGLTAYGQISASLRFPRKSVVVRGRRRYLLEAPTTCRGSWLFQQVNVSYDGTRLVANHRAPCLP